MRYWGIASLTNILPAGPFAVATVAPDTVRTAGFPIDGVDVPALLGRTQPLDVPTAVMVALLVGAAALSLPRFSWQYFGLFTTLVHELGHAFAALLSGRRVSGIRIHRNHAGSARTVGRGVLGTVISGFFGYPTPALVGAVLFWCVLTGYQNVALVAGTVVVALTLLFIRNWFGALVVVISGATSAAIWLYGSPTVQGYTLLVVGVALMVGSVRAFVGVVSVHTSRRRELASSDAYLLYQRTRIPSPIWLLLMAAVIGGSLYFAATTFAMTAA
ncbi:peptidase M50B-like protein [Glaciihabitans tibetensis]|uniref:Peptidase M50B-like protein n=1 Tax=Glaciihabitans tibetensis TaxID=1266600 RepID=A0A2T0VEE0_9MICO|nr:M50 family metallopeptidase [Glaciihabitans tibetensis]PRY68563.1 peptidase M50B-like protein [Glaciihabitans tibetensis]